ncbi:MAG: FISUMP domain-containing protein [Candidatus Gracilibacteria bacterium]|nr:FISUMP domain-containing protein [Candidatus Gracilibacteria bacterium]
MAFLEEESDDKVVSLKAPDKGIGFLKTNAIDYTDRFPKTTGKKLGILTDINNTPIHELPEISNFNGNTGSGYLDISDVADLELKSILKSDDILSGTGTTFLALNKFASVGGKFCGTANLTCRDLNIDENVIFTCGDTISALGETYTTELIIGNGGYEKCWTTQNMRHGTKLATGSDMPGDNTIIEKWCYDNSDTNCAEVGGLYTWNEAMGYGTSNNEDITKGICGQLGTGWKLPTDSEWTELTTAGATGWTGNKLSGIVSSLPRLQGYRNTSSVFGNNNVYGHWWNSTENSSNGWTRYLSTSDISVISSYYSKDYGFGMICIKN